MTWFKDGEVQPDFENLTSISVTTRISNDSDSLVEGSGNYACSATNRIGSDSAFSIMRAGIGLSVVHAHSTLARIQYAMTFMLNLLDC